MGGNWQDPVQHEFINPETKNTLNHFDSGYFDVLIFIFHPGIIS